MSVYPGAGQECVDYQDYMQWTGVLDLDGACNAVALSGQYGFMATSTTVAALQVVDLTIPEDPQLAAVLPLPGWPDDVALAGNVQTGSVVLTGRVFYEVLVRDTWAFVATLDDGVVIVDVANPQFPIAAAAATIPPGGCVDLALSGKNLYTALRSAGMAVHDVSDPRNPIYLGQVSATNRGVCVAVGEGMPTWAWAGFSRYASCSATCRCPLRKHTMMRSHHCQYWPHA